MLYYFDATLICLKVIEMCFVDVPCSCRLSTYFVIYMFAIWSTLFCIAVYAWNRGTGIKDVGDFVYAICAHRTTVLDRMSSSLESIHYG